MGGGRVGLGEGRGEGARGLGGEGGAEDHRAGYGVIRVG